jgi:glycosyltransferase involved in cell wall biosynthesis
MKVAAIVLTKNEQRHIERCIASLRALADEVVVVDSGSEDETCRIASKLGAIVYSHPWRNYATQLNWALDNTAPDADWILRIDADEFVPSDDASRLRLALESLSSVTTGVLIRRQIHFMGRWIRHGGLYPIWHLRIWRRGAGRCESRWMDEHIVLNGGNTARIHADIVDANLNTISWWTEKHNGYASREAVDIICLKYGLIDSAASNVVLDRGSKSKRWIKENLYLKAPIGVRAMIYFAHRYIFRLGFLDGSAGLVFHFLQGGWYRFLVDVKVLEVEVRIRSGESPIRAIDTALGIKL